MFENRSRGRDLAKKTSYVYIIFAILLTIVALMLNSDMGALALAERGTNLNAFIFGITLYIIFAAVIYLLSAKFENDEILWKLYIVIAVFNFVIIGFSIILVVLSLLLIVAGDDIRKELQ